MSVTNIHQVMKARTSLGSDGLQIIGILTSIVDCCCGFAFGQRRVIYSNSQQFSRKWRDGANYILTVVCEVTDA